MRKRRRAEAREAQRIRLRGAPPVGAALILDGKGAATEKEAVAAVG